jgi:hypothetical protein
VSHLTAPKLELQFDLVPFVEKLFGVPHFDEIIVRVDIHPEFDLLEL